jgi:hypothetical protein
VVPVRPKLIIYKNYEIIMGNFMKLPETMSISDISALNIVAHQYDKDGVKHDTIKIKAGNKLIGRWEGEWTVELDTTAPKAKRKRTVKTVLTETQG